MTTATEAGRTHRDLQHLETIIERMDGRELELFEIERFERALMRGHTSNLVKIDRIMQALHNEREGENR